MTERVEIANKIDIQQKKFEWKSREHDLHFESMMIIRSFQLAIREFGSHLYSEYLLQIRYRNSLSPNDSIQIKFEFLKRQ